MDKKYPSSSSEARKVWLAKQDPDKIKAQRQAQYSRKIARGGEEKKRHAYYEANKERIKAQTKAYAEAHPKKTKERRAAYYLKNKDVIIARALAWNKKHPEDVKKVKARRRKNHLQMNYNLTLEEYSQILFKQSGKCAICDTDKPGGRGLFHVDHDHQTQQIRGLLCHSCNVSLGGFKDSPVLLQQAINYLTKHNAAEAA